MSLFLCGNSAEMRETEGKSRTNGRQQKIQAIFEISGGIFFHGLEYLIRYEVVFCFIF